VALGAHLVANICDIRLHVPEGCLKDKTGVGRRRIEFENIQGGGRSVSRPKGEPDPDAGRAEED
jgi:hypothetical protein